MPSTYIYKLTTSGSSSMTLRLRHGPFPDDWDDNNGTGHCLAVSGGGIDSSQPNRLICHSGIPNKEPVVILNGASWDDAPSATGSADLKMAEFGCSSQWDWELISKT